MKKVNAMLMELDARFSQGFFKRFVKSNHDEVRFFN